LSRKYPGIYAVPGLRSNTAKTRYRLPDVAVLLSPPTTKYLLDPADIIIEILSEDDRMTKVLEKLAEYESKGVPHIWLADPRLKLMSEYHSGDLKHVETFRAGDIELSSTEVFSE
jgi:Uma2 family endonuclease